VIVALPVFPAAVARIVAVPAPTAVTSPELLTVATALLLEDHAKTVPVVAGLVAAVNWTVCPTSLDADEGETWIDLIAGPPLANAPSGVVGGSDSGPVQVPRSTAAAMHFHARRILARADVGNCRKLLQASFRRD